MPPKSVGLESLRSFSSGGLQFQEGLRLNHENAHCILLQVPAAMHVCSHRIVIPRTPSPEIHREESRLRGTYSDNQFGNKRPIHRTQTRVCPTLPKVANPRKSLTQKVPHPKGTVSRIEKTAITSLVLWHRSVDLIAPLVDSSGHTLRSGITI